MTRRSHPEAPVSWGLRIMVAAGIGIVVGVIRLLQAGGQGRIFLFLLPVAMFGVPGLIVLRNRQVSSRFVEDGWTFAAEFHVYADSAYACGLSKSAQGQWGSPSWNGTLAVNADRVTWQGRARGVIPFNVRSSEIDRIEWTEDSGLTVRTVPVLTIWLRDGRSLRMFTPKGAAALKHSLTASGNPAFATH